MESMTTKWSGRALLTLVLGCVVGLAGNASIAAGNRVEKTINREWTFNYFPAENADGLGCEAPAFDDSTWPAVAIPHTWQTYETTGELHPYIRNAGEKTSTYWWYGWGWYRKHFAIDKSQAG